MCISNGRLKLNRSVPCGRPLHYICRMKKFISVAFILLSLQTYAQDSLKLKGIDQLAKTIDNSKLNYQIDSVIKEMPEYGLKTKFYISHYFEDTNSLRKLIVKNDIVRTENGKEERMVTNSTFYYDSNKL